MSLDTTVTPLARAGVRHGRNAEDGAEPTDKRARVHEPWEAGPAVRRDLHRPLPGGVRP